MNIDKDKLLSNFKSIKNIANLIILKCKKVLFSQEGLLKNIGSYVLIFIILFLLISIFVFGIKQSNELTKKIEDIANSIKRLVFSKKGNKEETKNKENKKSENEITLGKITYINNDLDKKKNTKKFFKKKKGKKRKKRNKKKHNN